MGLEPRRSAESRMTICGLQTTLRIISMSPCWNFAKPRTFSWPIEQNTED
jgi:hypothetical protein